MNLYLIERPNGASYDEAEGFIIAAPDEETVRQLAALASADEGEGVWFDSRRSKVEQIGTTLPGVDRGVILSNFHAG